VVSRYGEADPLVIISINRWFPLLIVCVILAVQPTDIQRAGPRDPEIFQPHFLVSLLSLTRALICPASIRVRIGSGEGF
jgi:hypothetical protein